MSMDVSSDSTIEMVVQDQNLPPTSPSHQNRCTRSSQQGSSSSKLKGVIPLKGGMWGARITYNYKRYRLGTYETEIEAAKAYDRAAVKMPRAHSLNFHRSNYSVEESAFQSQYSIEEVLRMLQDKTYSSMLQNFILNHSTCVGFHAEAFMKEQEISYDFLFKKELSHMDVTHKCFLVQGDYASLHSPPIEDEGWNSFATLYDIHRRSWTFGCSYWQSTQSFIFTSGWGDFLEMYNLKEKDKIIIYRCRYQGDAVRRKFHLINVLRSTAESSVVGMTTEQDVGLRGSLNKELEADCTSEVKKRGFKLFGIEISG
ncbi:putative transcription factor RAV family [Rosa chinensis]|uniref:Putative transcription factor RAV family n=2 Tax=Rosa chinensis TaxID=74649 RepID=A0A2P6P8R2_ROSCH|nr:putative transcription factor RAV family [Rosa chinensis]